MDDKLTPMEAEVLEFSEEPEEKEPSDTYGTSAPPKTKRSYVGFWICLGIIIIVICSFGVVGAIRSVEVFYNEDGSWSLTMGPIRKNKQDDQVKNLSGNGTDPTEEVYESLPEGQLQLQVDEAERSRAKTAERIYAAVSPSVVCLEVTSSYGTMTYTGVVISEDGYILSATDGLGSALSVNVLFSDGTVLPAVRVGEEPRSGICLVRVAGQDLVPASFAFDDSLNVGSTIYCIANPYGTVLTNVLSEGLLSAKQTVNMDGFAFHLIQTSAELQSSGYGCPIIDSSGRVIGITTALGRYLVSETDPCFGVSAADLQQIVAAFSDRAQNPNVWLGIEVEEIPEAYRFLYRFPGSLWLTSVSEVSGYVGVLYPYDVVTAVNGMPVNTLEEYHELIDAAKPGDTVRLTIYRSGVLYYADLQVLRK